MLARVLKYSDIFAKTSALNATLLKYEDYRGLASSENVKDFAEKLGEFSSYKESSAEALAFGASRVAIERSLLTSLYDDFAALYGFVSDINCRKYLDAIFLQYALEIIKRTIRRLHDHRNARNISPKYGAFVTAHTGLDLQKIATSENFDELYENVRGTEVYDILSKVNRETATLFDYEIRMDFSAFNKRHKFQERLKEPALTPCRRLNGVDIDLRNIIWIYRAKHFYDIPNDKLFTYLIPEHHMLTAENIREFVAAESSEAFAAVLQKTGYKNVFTELTVGGMEKCRTMYMNEQHEEHRKTYSFMSVIAHLYFKRQEIDNLTTLIECVRYKRQPENAMSRLFNKAGDSLD